MDKQKNLNPGGGEVLPCAEDETCAVTTCAACMKEIPASVAQSEEGTDYLQHFCGLDCMDAWKAQQQRTTDPAKPD